jgi:SAM-dependent methyltransferase
LALQPFYNFPIILGYLNYYDDIHFSYPSFWKDREYEHESEVLALQKLLGNKRFECAADIGGGFGRLIESISNHARKIILIEPSVVQRTLATTFLPENISIQDGNSEETGLPVKSCDLVVMVRVMHHLPRPENSISEIWRIIKPGGLLVLEFANSVNFKSRVRHFLNFQSIPLTPIDVGVSIDGKVPFVNHNPKTVMLLLQREGFVELDQLSVSNFRSLFLKKLLPTRILLVLEQLLRRPLSLVRFGPSIFIMAKRPNGLKAKGVERLYK